MDAILLAGGSIHESDPLFEVAGGIKKALIQVAGKPMAQWVLDAVCQAERIEQVVVVGLEEEVGLPGGKPVHYLSDGGSMLANVKAGLEFIRMSRPTQKQVLLASSDIPTITPEIVDWRIRGALERGADLDYAVVARTTMEARFPDSRRSFIKLRDVEVCGGDLNVLQVGLVEHEQLWERIIAARKNAFRQASLLGWDLLLLVLTRRVGLERAEKLVSKRLGLDGCVTISPYAELAMDADKPGQLAILEEDLRSSAQA
jgi:GTP:adenosylcobinamide-phosphate guanylyltransferase